MCAWTSCACAGVAVRPVPIAQTGSYAMTRRCAATAPSMPSRPPASCASTISSVRPPSRSASISPTHTIAPRPAASAARAFLPTHSFGVAEELAALAVTDDRPGRAGIGEQRRRDLAGERAGGLPEAVLRARRDRAALETLRDRGEREEHRRDADRDALDRAELVLELGDERERFGDRLVELPVADHERSAHRRGSNTRTRTSSRRRHTRRRAAAVRERDGANDREAEARAALGGARRVEPVPHAGARGRGQRGPVVRDRDAHVRAADHGSCTRLPGSACCAAFATRLSIADASAASRPGVTAASPSTSTGTGHGRAGAVARERATSTGGARGAVVLDARELEQARDEAIEARGCRRGSSRGSGRGPRDRRRRHRATARRRRGCPVSGVLNSWLMSAASVRASRARRSSSSVIAVTARASSPISSVALVEPVVLGRLARGDALGAARQPAERAGDRRGEQEREQRGDRRAPRRARARA